MTGWPLKGLGAKALHDSVLLPSSHDTQCWELRLNPGLAGDQPEILSAGNTILLFPDPSR